ncbi:hypothetical protein SISNIDRAFT_530191 [Sistotremastrum niveocremeum HHB9708]|uniref:Uncharacterized protein n=1 Tax=Sistotremastrum niveocremeum HHB9708 TaxID=1314777 RepID=A0A164Z0J8_9AGAM|nr:hypothetical protein SISNIDRAFT_530191 [Sistotremastrum niveocremeum HHB9708]
MDRAIPRITIKPLMRPSFDDEDIQVPISEIQLLDGTDRHTPDLLTRWGDAVGLDTTVGAMQNRLERARGGFEQMTGLMLREGWRIYPRSEAGIATRLTYGYTEPTALGYQRPYSTVLIPTHVDSLLGRLNDPKEGWGVIFTQEIYRCAFHTQGPVQDIVFLLMVCFPGLIAFRYKLEDSLLTENNSMVLYVPPKAWLRRYNVPLAEIVGRQSMDMFLNLPYSQTYLIDDA